MCMNAYAFFPKGDLFHVYVQGFSVSFIFSEIKWQKRNLMENVINQ